MRRASAWVLAAVLSAAAAGAAGGLAVCQRVAHASEDGDLQAADRSMVEQYVADFGLRRDQVATLQAILRSLRRDESAIYRRNRANLPPAVLDELGTARRAAETRIKFMLDAGQRDRYEQKRLTENNR